MIDIFIVSLYLITILLIGIASSKNITSLQEYAITNRTYPIFVIIAALSATWIGGGTIIGLTEKVYNSGIIFLFIFLGDFVCKILNAAFVAPKIGNFYGLISSGDIMEQAYGRNAKILTGICGVLLSLGVIATQITAIGHFLGNFLQISKLTAILIGFGIIIIYATSGGVKAVTITDVLQFLTLVIGIPLILLFAVQKIGGVEIFLHSIPLEKLQINQPDNNLQHFGYFLTFALALSSPVFTQRLLMSKNPQQAIKAMNITAALDIPFYLLISLIGIAAFVLNQNIASTHALSYLIDQVLPVGAKGIAVVTILAAIMSTADSFLNAASICIVHDIVKPISNNKISEQKLLYLARVTTIILGIISIIIAYNAESVYMLLFYSRISWQPFIMVPFLAVILGYKFDKRSFYMGNVAALIVIIIWEYGNLNEVTKLHSILIGSLTNLVFFIISNYLFTRIKNGKIS
jgi:SSS family solute:Na+ symporter